MQYVHIISFITKKLYSTQNVVPDIKMWKDSLYYISTVIIISYWKVICWNCEKCVNKSCSRL